MRSWAFLLLLGSVCAFLQSGLAQDCDLSGKKADKPFPDIESLADFSYQLSVEYTIPDAKQTDYYVEYYDVAERMGRVDSHQDGKSRTYLYKTESCESWEITSDSCSFQNLTEIAEMLRDDQTDWIYVVANSSDETTYGPSAMFKNAFDSWKDSSKAGNMAYMGRAANTVRGLKAHYWRHCSEDKKSYKDYYFTDSDEEQPYGKEFSKTRFPLRVNMVGKREGEADELSTQQYDIIYFRPFIPADVKPFQLPKGKNCKRGPKAEKPEIPNFLDKSFMFSAEVIYRKIDRSGDEAQLWSYYSTLMMALDQQTQHLAYHYTPWDNSKKAGDEPDIKAPEYVVYDVKHGYAYKTNLESGHCQIIRDKRFIPHYELPENAGRVSLTDPSIIFPNSELTFITEGTNRGLRVNIFEEVVKNYVLDKSDEEPVQIPEAIISHSYLQDDEREVNVGTVKNALTQVQLVFRGRYEKVTEILTFNFFGFTTQIHNARFIFNTLRCFKNDNDYLWAQIGFNADPSVLQKIKQDVPSIQANILNSITMKSELNPMRIPIILVDVGDALYVNMLILGKPPIMLDYLEAEENKRITESNDQEGIEEKEICANRCLEEEDNCWGFSICGAKCTYGTSEGAKVTSEKGCTLYRRYNNQTFVYSKERMADNIRSEVKSQQVSLMVRGLVDEMIQLDASSIEITEPDEDEKVFDITGHTLNPRMKVKKVGAKLKSSAGSGVKNLGRLRYDECQNLCLNYKECETVSYCLPTFECLISSKYDDEVKDEDIENDNMCNLLTRKYADHFDRSAGNILSITAEEVLPLDTVEKCARACLTNSKYRCLSFDHCPTDEKSPCKLHTVHYPNANTREKFQVKDTNCGHYTRKFSTEFNKFPERRMVGSKVPPLNNVTLEECSKSCVEYGGGLCYGFDFCQDVTILATSCTLLDKNPATTKTTYSQICTNFLRIQPQEAPRPYTNSYAGGIGFLCFLIGSAVGACIVFGIAYMKVNRR